VRSLLSPRLALLPAIAVSPVIASADRLIEIPVGRKLPAGAARLEHLWEPGDFTRSRTYLGYGIDQGVEVEFLYDRIESRAGRIEVDLSYQYYPAFIDQVPAVRFGIRDLGNSGSRGNRVYVAATYLFTLEGELNANERGEFTVGAMSGGRNSIFVGILLPFSESLRVMAEHDGMRVTAGLELRPADGLALKWLFRPNQTLVSLSLSRRF